MTDNIEFDPIGGAIAALEAQIVKLRSAIETLEGVRGSIGAVAAPPVRNGTETNFTHDAFFGMTAADATKKYLGSIRKTAPVKTIADVILAGGWKTSSKNVTENLRTILYRHPAFVVINGEIGLTEWYPGRKNTSKARTVSTQPSTDGAATVGAESPSAEQPAILDE